MKKRNAKYDIQNTKVIIGLTGGFGTGKSTVAEFFKAEGALVLDADSIAHECLKPSHPISKKIKRMFPEAVDAKGLNRKKLAEKVFKNKAALKRLEGVIHPYVLKTIAERVKKTRKSLIVLNVPLLYEAGWDAVCNLTVVVKANQAETLKRLKAKGFSSREVAERRKQQWPLKEKVNRADFAINNSGTRRETQKEFKKTYKKIMEVIG